MVDDDDGDDNDDDDNNNNNNPLTGKIRFLCSSEHLFPSLDNSYLLPHIHITSHNWTGYFSNHAKIWISGQQIPPAYEISNV